MIDGVGHSTDDPGYVQHMKVREELRLAVLESMADRGLDALVYASFDHDPTLIPADFMTASLRSQPGSNRTLSVMIGFPALTVPAGFTSGGLPVGIEFLSRPFAEGTLFQIAYGYEQGTHHRRPPVTAPPL
jgi:Asp-tRNA(Asn)/Glu-tRNA(Gln) amidotransferase A subunit family amidase